MECKLKHLRKQSTIVIIKYLRREKARTSRFEKHACSAVDHDALLHWETILVVTASQLENVALVSFS